MVDNLAALAQRYNVDARTPNADFMVTVAQLRQALAGYPDEAYVILVKDAEGNGYSPLATTGAGTPDVQAVWYHPECTWAGETYPIGGDADGEVHEPVAGKDLFAVELGPVN